jgi:hypothetical protein
MAIGWSRKHETLSILVRARGQPLAFAGHIVYGMTREWCKLKKRTCSCSGAIRDDDGNDCTWYEDALDEARAIVAEQRRLRGEDDGEDEFPAG